MPTNVSCLCFGKKNPVRGGDLTGLIGGGNEGKEETSFLLLIDVATTMPFAWYWRRYIHIDAIWPR